MRRVGKKIGDTLVEVTIAIGIFSLVAIGVVAVVSNSTSGSQAALENTVTREEMDAQAEALRFIQNSYLTNADDSGTYESIWDAITKNANAPSDAVLAYTVSECGSLYQNTLENQHAFIINTRKLRTGKTSDIVKKFDSSSFIPATTYPRIVFDEDNGSDLISQDAGTNIQSVEGIFIIAVENDNTTNVVEGGDVVKRSAYYDFYIRTCWYGSNSNTPTTISTVVRLYNPKAIASDKEPHFSYNYATVHYIDEGEEATDAQHKVPSGMSAKYAASQFNRDDMNEAGDKYKFVGWCTEEPEYIGGDCNGNLHKANDQNDLYSAPAALLDDIDVYFYATWEKRPKYTITFKANGGKGSMSAQTYWEGLSQAIKPNSFKRDHYIFSGWCTGSAPSGTNCKSGSNSYSDGQTIALNGNITLYAKWKAIPRTTLVYNCNGGIGSTNDAIYSGETGTIKTVNSVCTPPTGMRATGKWCISIATDSNSSNCYKEGDDYSPNISANTTLQLYAQWELANLTLIDHENLDNKYTSVSKTFDATTFKRLRITGTAKISYSDCHSSTSGWATGKIQMVLKSGSTTHAETLVSESFQNNTGCWEDGSHCDGHWKSGSTSKTLDLVVDLPSKGINANNAIVTFEKSDGGVFCTGGYGTSMNNITVVVSGS